LSWRRSAIRSRSASSPASRPGGNITGQSFFNAELRAKRIELLKEVMPRLKEVAVLLNADNPATGPEFQAVEAAAQSLDIKLQPFRLRASSELVGAFERMEQTHMEAVETADDPLSTGNVGAIVALAARVRLLSIGPEEVARAGGIMGYGVDLAAMYRHAAFVVDRILKGANPADLPIERASKFQFVLNLKTAHALGLDVPTATLLRADEVIE
jgi:putative ABC transport system substrate-binding protein